MAIEIIPINGKCGYFDYTFFEQDVYSTLARLGNTCKNIKIFLFNNFPIPVSNYINIDLLLIIVVEKTQGNYYMVRKKEKSKIYFYNQIIPVKFITNYQNKKIKTIDEKGKIIYAEDAELDFSTEINALKKGLANYLKEKVKLKDADQLYINPLIFIQNERKKHITNNYLVANHFTFENLNEYFWKNEEEKYFISYPKWKKEGVFGFVVDNDIKKIIDQAAEDSKYGYLTKKKIDLLTSQLNNIKTLKEEIEEKKLISIEGKAGTGKTNRLLSIAQYCLKQNKNVLFLTYNRLLVYDICLLLQSDKNRGEKTQQNLTETTFKNVSFLSQISTIYGNLVTCTFHSFFYNLCRKMGVTKLLNQKRFDEVTTILKKSMDKVYEVLKNDFNNIENLLINNKERKKEDILKTFFQNHRQLNETEVSYAVEYINFTMDMQELLKEENVQNFVLKKEEDCKQMYFSIEKELSLFLNDYEKFLRVLYKTLTNTQEFYDEYNVENSYKLLNLSLGIDSGERKHLVENNKIVFESYNKLIEGKISFLDRYDVICIDEAQDCENIEKELLLYIFYLSKGEKKTIAIANGGQEQLIRYGKLCDWKDPKIKTNVVSHTLKRKSLRNKATIIDFCNFIAEKGGFDIENFKLEPLESEDKGEIIFDFRTTNDISTSNLFLDLRKKGELNFNTIYESILTLTMPEDEKPIKQENDEVSYSIKVNENNYIENNNILEKKTDWMLLDTLESRGINCYSATRDKNEPFQSFNDMRVMHYESCRGLEAWSVCCFSLNHFFYNKYFDEKAERYLLSDKNLINEKRKLRYATSWLLMALTRAMDTLYIQVKEKSEIQKEINKKPDFKHINFLNWIEEYIYKNQTNNNIKVIR